MGQVEVVGQGPRQEPHVGRARVKGYQSKVCNAPLLFTLLVLSCTGASSDVKEASFEVPKEISARVGATEGPALFAGFSMVDFGTIWQGAVREVRFPLTSSGTEPVHIARLKASCGCTLASSAVVENGVERELVLGEPLAPGTRMLVTLRFDSRGREGHEEKLVTIYGDMPGGKLLLHVNVETQPFLHADPEPLAFGRVFVGTGVESSTTITAPTAEPFALKLSEQVPLPKGLRLELVPGGDVNGSRAISWLVIAHLSEEMAAGNLFAHVTLISDLTFDTPGDLAALKLAPGVVGAAGNAFHYLDLWTTAAVVGAVEVSPSYLPFGLLTQGALTSASARIECFDPAMEELFRSAPPTVYFLDKDGNPLAGAASQAFTPTLRLVRPEEVAERPLSEGAIAAWDLEVAALGFSGGGQNLLVGQVQLDFAAKEIPDLFINFQVILQP